MSVQRVVARNVIWNWAGIATQMAVGFVVAPFLYRWLGETRYGLWLLIASLTSYFALLDLGVCGSVGRNLAFHRAKGDQDGANAIVRTALALLSGVALLVVLGTFALVPVFFHWFDVPAHEAADVRLAVLLVGCNLALTFPLAVFDAILWAGQRFDLQNAVDIPNALLRAGLTFWLIGVGHGLVALGVVTVLTTLLGAALKAGISFRLERNLRVGRAFVRWQHAGELFGYGFWYFLLTVGRRLPGQVAPPLIGARLGVPLVPFHNVAARLTGYADSLLIAGTQVLTPVATGLHAQERRDEQQTLFLEGGKYCTVLVLFFVGLFVCLGEPLITLWMGPGLAAAATLLTILALGEMLPMSQWISYSMILGMGRHRELACFCLVENAVAVVLALLLLKPFGLVGVCVAFAVPGALCRGICQMVYACRLVRVPLLSYLVRALLPALAVAVLPILGLALVSAWRPPTGWFEFLGYAAIYGLVYVVIGALGLVGWGQLRPHVAVCLRSVFGTRPVPQRPELVADQTSPV